MRLKRCAGETIVCCATRATMRWVIELVHRAITSMVNVKAGRARTRLVSDRLSTATFRMIPRDHGVGDSCDAYYSALHYV